MSGIDSEIVGLQPEIGDVRSETEKGDERAVWSTRYKLDFARINKEKAIDNSRYRY